MRHMDKRGGFFAGLCVIVVLGGCTGAELAVIGAASSGLETGQEITRMGRLKLALMEEGPAVVGAAEQACHDLGLRIYHVEQKTPHSWAVSAAERRRTLRIIVQERAPRLTQIEVNVGIFGSQSIAELILKRVVAALEEKQAEPAAG